MMTPFDVRSRLKWEGLSYREPAPGLPESFPPTLRGRTLFESYQLARFEERVCRETIEECLGTLDLLDHIPASELLNGAVTARTPIQALDVGAKNWRYSGALAAWLSAHGLEARVDGVELDAYRVYSNLRTRMSYARHYCEAFSSEAIELRYHAGDIQDWIKPADLITWLFPFVSPAPHRAWGLPLKHFDPQPLFAHVERLLVPGGRLVMFNQGDWEFEAAKSLFQSLRLRYQEVVEGSLHASDQPIFLTLWTRED
jgi:SAM-dependent methyltransferase